MGTYHGTNTYICKKNLILVIELNSAFSATSLDRYFSVIFCFSNCF
uniref:Uncharacterized protein n=1 Tax=Arundo donax TaxID=35708 RepID=A0A0A9GY76_ARUDO